MDKPKPKKLEETCGSQACAYKGHGVCTFVEGQFCPMYSVKKDEHGKD